MSTFNVLILGSASAIPSLNRNPTSQLININEKYFLVDCGEGTQLQLRKNNINFNRLNHIFISHLHGDHYLGLTGLLQTMNLLGRDRELVVFGPKDLEEVITVHFKYAKSYPSYPLKFVALDASVSSIIYENDEITVETIILDHRLPCTGFLFKEKTKPRRVKPAAILHYNIPKYAINKLKFGCDYITQEGDIIQNSLLTSDSLPSFSYAFCSDTAYNEKIIPLIRKVSLLYHEATFLDKDKDKAMKTKHSTAKEAAMIAKKSDSNYLIIGHFSNRYSNLEELLNEAKSVFEKTALATEGSLFKIAETQSCQC